MPSPFWWGAIPPRFIWPPSTGNWNPQPPEIPAGLPADLLERRPDVAQAERQLASANARIGVAKAAFFPVLTLTGSGGYLSADVDTLFNWNSHTWSIGPSLSLPIFTGGRNRANLPAFQMRLTRNPWRTTGSRFSSRLAKWRTAFRASVISQINHPRNNARSPTPAARRPCDSRYRSGIVSYIEVVDAEPRRA